MNLITLELGELATNCYILTDENSAVVIDPAADAALILKELESRRSKLESIVYTHAHCDHIGGSGELKRATGATVYMGRNENEVFESPVLSLFSWLETEEKPAPPDTLVSGGDEIPAGDIRLKVLDTPGHTPGGISLLAGKFLFTGDALFSGSIGRTDFPGSDHQALIESINSHILSLEDDVRIYPGHGPSTTVGRERTSNPFLNG